MSETNTAPVPAYKMTIDETVKTLQSYAGQAESSLAQLQQNIDSATNQINEWRRIQLMIVGQKKLLDDLIGKTVTTPANDPGTPDATAITVSDTATK